MIVFSLYISNASLCEVDSSSFTSYIVEYSEVESNDALFNPLKIVKKEKMETRAVSKRFNEFYEFRSFLEQRGFVSLPLLASKTILRNVDNEFVEERKKNLQVFHVVLFIK